MRPWTTLFLVASLAAAGGHVRGAEPVKAPGCEDAKVVSDRWPDGSSLRQFALDAVRISGAKTEKQKALAVFRWMRRWTMKLWSKLPTTGSAASTASAM